MANIKKLSLLVVVIVPVLLVGYLIFDNHQMERQRYEESLGSTVLSWTAPTENDDASQLTDLSGYIIHCWTVDAGENERIIRLSDPGLTSYEVERLEPGNYFCAVTAVNADGDESILSNIVAKTVP